MLTVPVQPRLKTPRVFVPYLWDAIKAYHVAIRAVIERGERACKVITAFKAP